MRRSFLAPPQILCHSTLQSSQVTVNYFNIACHYSNIGYPFSWTKFDSLIRIYSFFICLEHSIFLSGDSYSWGAVDDEDDASWEDFGAFFTDNVPTAPLSTSPLTTLSQTRDANLSVVLGERNDVARRRTSEGVSGDRSPPTTPPRGPSPMSSALVHYLFSLSAWLCSRFGTFCRHFNHVYFSIITLAKDEPVQGALQGTKVPSAVSTGREENLSWGFTVPTPVHWGDGAFDARKRDAVKEQLRKLITINLPRLDFNASATFWGSHCEMPWGFNRRCWDLASVYEFQYVYRSSCS